MKKYKVGIIGITGRMGKSLFALLNNDINFDCIGGISSNTIPDSNITRFTSFDELAKVSDILIDFSSTEASISAIKSAHNFKKPIVIGTTGFSDDQISIISNISTQIPVLLSSNFSTGINILLFIAEHISKTLYEKDFDIEIQEKHHKNKKDAPSGTALSIAKTIETSLNKENLIKLNNYNNTRLKGDIGLSFIRGGGIIGEHSVSFISNNEILEITHKAINREIFANGAIVAAKWLLTQKPGMYNMQDVLNL